MAWPSTICFCSISLLSSAREISRSGVLSSAAANSPKPKTIRQMPRMNLVFLVNFILESVFGRAVECGRFGFSEGSWSAPAGGGRLPGHNWQSSDTFQVRRQLIGGQQQDQRQ